MVRRELRAPVSDPGRSAPTAPLALPPRRELQPLAIPPLRHRTVYVADEEAAERFNELRSTERIAALKRLETDGIFVQRETYLRIEDGRRLGSSGYNFYLLPSERDAAANFCWKRLGETGAARVEGTAVRIRVQRRCEMHQGAFNFTEVSPGAPLFPLVPSLGAVISTQGATARPAYYRLQLYPVVDFQMLTSFPLCSYTLHFPALPVAESGA